MYLLRHAASALLTASVLTSSAAAQAPQLEKLHAGQASSGDLFGNAVAAGPGRFVVGAVQDSPLAGSSGAVYVFERPLDAPAGAWPAPERVFPADGAQGDNAGHAVALSGDRMILSSLRDNGSAGTDQGSAYIFDRQPDGSWIESAKLEPVAPVAFDEFGWSVALSGDYAAVGSYRNSEAGTIAGRAWIFERQPNGDWLEVANVTGSDITELDQFGWSMALSGDTLLVGATLHALQAGQGAGAVYVFERAANGVWSEVDKLTATDTIALDYFGYSVAIDGERAIIGAREAESFGEPFGEDEGAAYIFERNAGTWEEVARLEASNAAASAEFGYAVGISGERAVVGARNADQFGGNAGAAYLFERDAAGDWQETELVRADPQSNDLFGYSAAISGDRVVVGARGDDDFGNNSGSAYVFDAEPLSRAASAPLTLSLATGGPLEMLLDAGEAHAGELYWLLGSTAGTTPGLPLGPGLVLPLNPDFYLNLTLSNPNQAPLSNSFTLLDAGGHGAATFTLPNDITPAIAGVTIHHAFAVVDPVAGVATFVSNALAVELVP